MASDFKAVTQRLFDTYVSCYRAGDAAGCAAIYSTDAELFSPFGPPAKGIKEIAALHRDWLSEGGETKEIEVLSAGCSGDLGWCVANFSEHGLVEGLSLNVLARQSDSSWKITHCSLNEHEAD